MLNYPQFLAENLINMNWKHWPYWLRGGVVGGGVALGFYLLAYMCFLVGGDYFCLIFYIAGPIYPAGLFLNLFEPVFNYSSAVVEASAPILSVPIWFIFGSLIGALAGSIKSKNKKSPPERAL